MGGIICALIVFALMLFFLYKLNWQLPHTRKDRGYSTIATIIYANYCYFFVVTLDPN
jgi:hypothetical protein